MDHELYSLEGIKRYRNLELKVGTSRAESFRILRRWSNMVQVVYTGA
jgi:hypothetical protein